MNRLQPFFQRKPAVRIHIVVYHMPGSLGPSDSRSALPSRMGPVFPTERMPDGIAALRHNWYNENCSRYRRICIRFGICFDPVAMQ